jgi:hypothetical protein
VPYISCAVAIPGCTTGTHSNEKQQPIAPVAAPESNAAAAAAASVPSTAPPAVPAPIVPSKPIPPEPVREHLRPAATRGSTPFPVPDEGKDEQDPPGAVVANGAKCKRTACGAEYKEGMERDDKECVFHPGARTYNYNAFFRDGSLTLSYSASLVSRRKQGIQ